MRVEEIQEAVVAHLRELHPDPEETLIRCELGLCLGETRVDVAAVNGKIVGWEIKSAQDRLTRLPKQVDIYGRVLDEAIIVAAGKHAAKVETLVPSWWGIVWIDESAHGRPFLKFKRQPQQNKFVNAFAVAQLLWRDEAYEILKRYGAQGGLSKATRWHLWERLTHELPQRQLELEVRNQLRARQEW